MNKEFNLSNEIEEYAGWKDEKISVEKVRKFIRLFKKELINRYSTEPNLRIDIRDWEFIDKLAGDKLK